MASYITQYLPNFKNSLSAAETSKNVESLNSVGPGQIKYIAVIDTGEEVSDSKEESDSELSKRLITFVHSDTSTEISPNVKIRLAGLMQGVYAFSSEFITTPKAEKSVKKPMIVSSEGESFVVVQIEKSYSLICSIASNDQTVTKQLQYLLNQQHSFFKLFHKSLKSIKEDTGDDVLRDLSSRWWSEFLSDYNQNLSTRDIKWPHIFNYSGFNNMIADGYRKSSISISKRVKDEFKGLLLSEELIPHGLVISSFAPVVKKMGLIHIESLVGGLEYESLVDLHKWMEFDYVMRTTSKRGRNDRDSHAVAEEDTLGFMNPINLTNSLVVSPWNKMSDMIRGESAVNSTENNENSQTLKPKTSRAWLSMPSVFGGDSSEVENSSLCLPSADDGQESVKSVEDVLCRFLYGIQPDQSILRKLVYLSTNIARDDDRSEKVFSESEYQLVTYFRDDICITLVYDSSETARLDSAEFYKHLSLTILNPLQEEVVSYQASTLGTSTNSIATLNLAKIDNNFLYTVVDFKQMNYTSSIPLILDEQDEKFATIVNIHNQLIKISRNFDFSAHEFYHKFTLGNKHDWMSYIIKYGHKLIVIIKNNTKNSSGVSAYSGGGKSTAIPPEERTVVNQITGIVSDYASLGFLDNLGDDVKYWLGQVIDTE
ncbi:CCZ1 [Candida theae]|uniref:CCZ1 n=1 Tax=Candida theae TaxID=1198502 RepID=A0AAD5BIZ9_9ASCO|nr:CCZ1 [Candida theae]KAI5966017.1 CCZ1 [Candida theae]